MRLIAADMPPLKWKYPSLVRGASQSQAGTPSSPKISCAMRRASPILTPPSTRRSYSSKRDGLDALWFATASLNVTSVTPSIQSRSTLSSSAPCTPSASFSAKVSESDLVPAGKLYAPLINSWSRTSMFVEISFADSESVRAISRFDEPRMSQAKRVVMRRFTCSPVDTSTLPAWCPHFLPPCSWSSR